MNKKTTVFLLILSIVITAFAILAIVALSQYIDTYEPWYSFLSLESAIIYLIVVSIVALAAIIAFALSLIKLFRIVPKDRD